MSTLRERIEALADELTQDDDFASATSLNSQIAQVLRDILAEPEQHRFNRSALSLADFAFMETPGPDAARVKAAIVAYLFALNSRQRLGDGWVYPSLSDMRAHLATLRAQAERRDAEEIESAGRREIGGW